MTTEIAADPNIYLDGNDKHEAFDLTTPHSLTGEPTPATGLVGLTIHYSATKGGATIHTDLSKSLTEYTNTPGRYHATEEGDQITAQLATYVNQRIFAVLKDSGGNVRKNFDRYVRANRYDE